MQLFREALGAALRRLRHAQRLSLRQLAAKADVSATYLGEVERGLKEPSSEMLAQIAGALDASVADLLCRVVAELRQTGLGPTQGGEGQVSSATVCWLGAALEAEDLYALARFGEFLSSRRERKPQA